MTDRQDRIRGSLIGGAAGDALGYAVEFEREDSIFARYGEGGIRQYRLDPGSGLAPISDDTQMTLFTAWAMSFSLERALDGRSVDPRLCAALAYRDWLLTQEMSYAEAARQTPGFPIRYPEGPISGPLLRLPELYARRAPGNTCLSALAIRRKQLANNIRVDSYIGNPLNQSKGCGGVMRAAPVGMIPWADIRSADREAAEIAAVTHGHSLGYMPAAVLAHIVQRLIYNNREQPLREIVGEARDAAAKFFARDAHIRALTALIDRAIALSEAAGSDLEHIHSLGEGWVGDEALAIAIYCSLRYPDDLSRALIAAVNHKGDSDSTGAITGNILGAKIGYRAIGREWTDRLELHDAILRTADGLNAAVDRLIGELSRRDD